MDRVGIAFIGAGIVAEMHGRGVAATPAAKLIGVYDPAESKARAIARKFGGRVFKSLEEALADPKVHAVHVLTPPAHHARIAEASLRAGRHVLVEKPVAWKYGEIEKLQSTARKSNRVCMPAHNYIYVPALQRAKRLIDNGSLGAIASLWIIYNIFHPEEIAAIYGGVLRAVCVHHAYSLLYLLGRPSRLMSTVSRIHYEKLLSEDQAMIVCEMPSGTIANLWCSFAASDSTSDPWTVVYKILGTKGGLVYSWNEAQFQDDRGPGWGLPCYEESFMGEIQHFVNHCILRGKQPLSTLADAADALRIVEASERSAQRPQTMQRIRY